jgi:hypothetical protein
MTSESDTFIWQPYVSMKTRFDRLAPSGWPCVLLLLLTLLLAAAEAAPPMAGLDP